MNFGSLRLVLPTGEVRELLLELPQATVGRGEGATISIEDFSISRRHARLTVDSGRLLVEDAASAAGTFLDDEQLAPHTSYLVAPGASLRFGDVIAHFTPAPVQDATAGEAADDSPFGPGGLVVAMVSPAMPVDPGKTVTATATVTNRGRVVDEVELSVPELPADWYTIDTPQLSLVPGGRAEVTVTLHPPRRSDALAGDYVFSLSARSQEQQREEVAPGTFTLLPFTAVEVSLAAVRSKRHFRVFVENRGNEPVSYNLAGRDDAQAFSYGFERTLVSVLPGEKAAVALEVRRPREWFGPARNAPFEVVAAPPAGTELTARGQLAVHPPLQKFKMPVLAGFAVILLAFTALAIFTIADDGGVQEAGAESEYEGVHLCDEPDAADEQAKQAERNADAAAEGPDEAATVAGSGSGGQPLFGQADSNGAPFFAQNDPRWNDVEYARSTELAAGTDWCGTTIGQCGCAMTSVSVMLALYGVMSLPDGTALTPQSLNAWFNGEATRTDRGWVSRGYIYGDVIWTAANELSGEIARLNPGSPTIRFSRTGSGSEDEIRAELNAGRPVILEVPGHWIAAVGLEGDKILINDPFYRDRKTLDAYAGKVRSSVIYEPSADLSAVVFTAPMDVTFRVTDRQGRVVEAGGAATDGTPEPTLSQIPGASVSQRRAWRDPTCIEKAPPAGAGTNQIVLPGSAGDYTIEIVETGDGPASVAIHTYGRDGHSSVATIDATATGKAEVLYDPSADAPIIRVDGSGTPTPPTPTPDADGAGGGPSAETATPSPATTPPPATATPTPFVEVTTNMALAAEPGQTRVETASNSGFELGDPVRLAPGQPNEEDNIIVGFGSFILAEPLKFAHGPGEQIKRLPRPPGQGPGLPPGVTPPPSTGPIEPPSTVGMACSTIYQPSPKQATFICDLEVTGDYTTTRWSLNGRVVDDFTGSRSFLMAFPGDTPASIAATVCNVTICRSVSRNENIAFPANLGGTTTTAGGTAPGAGASPTPPPAGTVAVVCATSFEITDTSQFARINCQASFAGEFTSISWSAPGATPANGSGVSKTFKTSLENKPGVPVSVKIQATVCNFGQCRTSNPQTVGVGQTRTIIDTQPQGSVPLRNSVTLLAIVSGTNGIVPQGGTVQFFADDIPINPSTPLFTIGSLSVAQTGIQTGSVAGLTSLGQHTVRAVYSGGINAFGSQSNVADIVVDPPIPDGCDSVDDDPQPGNSITDGTCDFSTPKDLGGGTVLNDFSINGQTGAGRNTAIVSPGATFTVAGSAGRTTYCPGCIRQVYVGIGANATAGTAATTPICVLSATMPLAPAGPGFANVTLTAPTTPGVYYLRGSSTLDYFCVGAQTGPPDKSIGRIIVRAPVTPAIEIRDEAGNTPVNGTDEGGRVTLVATVPAGVTGRVDFSQIPVLASNPGDPPVMSAPVAPICPPSGVLPDGAGTKTCTPGEARVTTNPLAGSATTIAVTATYVDPNPLRLLDFTTDPDGVDVAVPIWIPGSPSSSTSGGCATPSVNGCSFRILMDTDIDLTVSPDPAVMGAPLQLRAVVTAANDPGISGNGGAVQFRVGNTNLGGPVAVTSVLGVDGVAEITWTPCTGTPACGPNAGPPFDTHDEGSRSLYDDVTAVYTNGGTSPLRTETSAPINVDIDRAASTTTLGTVTSTTSPATIGDTLTVPVTVTGPFTAEGGTIEVLADGDTADSYTFVAGDCSYSAPSWTCSATVTVTTGAAPIADSGTYDITAAFAAHGQLAGSTSAATSITLVPADPAISTTGPATMTVGASQTLRVVVATSNRPDRLDNNCAPSAGGAACGDVELLGTGLSTAPRGPVESLGGGVYGRDFALSGLSAGIYSLTGHYTGNAYFEEVTSAPHALTVGKATPTVTLGSVSGVDIGASLSLSATVSGSGITSPTGGTVTFLLGATVLGTDTVSGGTAALSVPTGASTSFATAGAYSGITARFEATTNLNTATSNSEGVTLAKRTPAVTVTAPSATLGSTISISASVTTGSGAVSPDCTACVQFKVGNTLATAVDLGTPQNVSAGTATLTGITTGTGTFGSAGTYTIWAVYDGNTNVNAGSDSTSLHLASTVALTVTVPASGTMADAPFSLSAALVPNTATGSVQFKVNGVNVGGGVTVSGGAASRSWTPSAPGTYTITATYTSNSVNFLDNTDEASAPQIVVSGAPTTLAATAPATATAGANITLTGTITSAFGSQNDIDQGTVQFFINGTAEGAPLAVNNGVATLTITRAAGTYQLTASYTGGGNYAGSADTTNFTITVT